MKYHAEAILRSPNKYRTAYSMSASNTICILLANWKDVISVILLCFRNLCPVQGAKQCFQFTPPGLLVLLTDPISRDGNTLLLLAYYYKSICNSWSKFFREIIGYDSLTIMRNEPGVNLSTNAKAAFILKLFGDWLVDIRNINHTYVK